MGLLKQISRHQEARLKRSKGLFGLVEWIVSLVESASESTVLVGTLFLLSIELASFTIYVYIDLEYVTKQTNYRWNVNNYPIPKSLFFIQSSFSFFFVIIWSLMMLSHGRSLRDKMLTFRTITTMLTAIPQLVVFFWQFADPAAANGYIPMFLRIWWIHYYARYVISMPFVPLSEQVRDTTSVLSPLVAVMITAAGLYSITVRYSDEKNISGFDSLYYCFVTFGTIGYGDLSPKTVVGMLFVICMIVTAIYIFPQLFSKLTEIISRRKLFSRVKPRPHGRHVIVVGTFTLKDIRWILQELFTEDRLFTRMRVVFLSPEVYPPEVYLFASSPRFNESVRLIIGSAQNTDDLDRCCARTADAIFLMSNIIGRGGSGGDANSAQSDYENVVTAQTLHHYDRNLPIHVILKRATTRQFVSKFASVIMVSEIIKMNLMGLGAILPGALPLIVNLVKNYDNPDFVHHHIVEKIEEGEEYDLPAFDEFNEEEEADDGDSDATNLDPSKRGNYHQAHLPSPPRSYTEGARPATSGPPIVFSPSPHSPVSNAFLSERVGGGKKDTNTSNKDKKNHSAAENTSPQPAPSSVDGVAHENTAKKFTFATILSSPRAFLEARREKRQNDANAKMSGQNDKRVSNAKSNVVEGLKGAFVSPPPPPSTSNDSNWHPTSSTEKTAKIHTASTSALTPTVASSEKEKDRGKDKEIKKAAKGKEVAGEKETAEKEKEMENGTARKHKKDGKTMGFYHFAYGINDSFANLRVGGPEGTEEESINSSSEAYADDDEEERIIAEETIAPLEDEQVGDREAATSATEKKQEGGAEGIGANRRHSPSVRGGVVESNSPHSDINSQRNKRSKSLIFEKKTSLCISSSPTRSPPFSGGTEAETERPPNAQARRRGDRSKHKYNEDDGSNVSGNSQQEDGKGSESAATCTTVPTPPRRSFAADGGNARTNKTIPAPLHVDGEDIGASRRWRHSSNHNGGHGYAHESGRRRRSGLGKSRLTHRRAGTYKGGEGERAMINNPSFATPQTKVRIADGHDHGAGAGRRRSAYGSSYPVVRPSPPKPDNGGKGKRGLSSSSTSSPSSSAAFSSSSSDDSSQLSLSDEAPWQVLYTWSVGNELYTIPVPLEFVGSDFTAINLAMAAYTVTVIGIVNAYGTVMLNPAGMSVREEDSLICIAQDITHVADALQALYDKIISFRHALRKADENAENGESNTKSRKRRGGGSTSITISSSDGDAETTTSDSESSDAHSNDNVFLQSKHALSRLQKKSKRLLRRLWRKTHLQREHQEGQLTYTRKGAGQNYATATTDRHATFPIQQMTGELLAQQQKSNSKEANSDRQSPSVPLHVDRAGGPTEMTVTPGVVARVCPMSGRSRLIMKKEQLSSAKKAAGGPLSVRKVEREGDEREAERGGHEPFGGEEAAAFTGVDIGPAMAAHADGHQSRSPAVSGEPSHFYDHFAPPQQDAPLIDFTPSPSLQRANGHEGVGGEDDRDTAIRSLRTPATSSHRQHIEGGALAPLARRARSSIECRKGKNKMPTVGGGLLSSLKSTATGATDGNEKERSEETGPRRARSMVEPPNQKRSTLIFQRNGIEILPSQSIHERFVNKQKADMGRRSSLLTFSKMAPTTVVASAGTLASSPLLAKSAGYLNVMAERDSLLGKAAGVLAPSPHSNEVENPPATAGVKVDLGVRGERLLDVSARASDQQVLAMSANRASLPRNSPFHDDFVVNTTSRQSPSSSFRQQQQPTIVGRFGRPNAKDASSPARQTNLAHLVAQSQLPNSQRVLFSSISLPSTQLRGSSSSSHRGSTSLMAREASSRNNRSRGAGLRTNLGGVKWHVDDDDDNEDTQGDVGPRGGNLEEGRPHRGRSHLVIDSLEYHQYQHDAATAPYHHLVPSRHSMISRTPHICTNSGAAQLGLGMGMGMGKGTAGQGLGTSHRMCRPPLSGRGSDEGLYARRDGHDNPLMSSTVREGCSSTAKVAGRSMCGDSSHLLRSTILGHRSAPSTTPPSLRDRDIHTDHNMYSSTHTNPHFLNSSSSRLHAADFPRDPSLAGGDRPNNLRLEALEDSSSKTPFKGTRADVNADEDDLTFSIKKSAAGRSSLFHHQPNREPIQVIESEDGEGHTHPYESLGERASPTEPTRVPHSCGANNAYSREGQTQGAAKTPATAVILHHDAPEVSDLLSPPCVLNATRSEVANTDMDEVASENRDSDGDPLHGRGPDRTPFHEQEEQRGVGGVWRPSTDTLSHASDRTEAYVERPISDASLGSVLVLADKGSPTHWKKKSLGGQGEEGRTTIALGEAKQSLPSSAVTGSGSFVVPPTTADDITAVALNPPTMDSTAPNVDFSMFNRETAVWAYRPQRRGTRKSAAALAAISAIAEASRQAAEAQQLQKGGSGSSPPALTTAAVVAHNLSNANNNLHIGTAVPSIKSSPPAVLGGGRPSPDLMNSQSRSRAFTSPPVIGGADHGGAVVGIPSLSNNGSFVGALTADLIPRPAAPAANIAWTENIFGSSSFRMRPQERHRRGGGTSRADGTSTAPSSVASATTERPSQNRLRPIGALSPEGAEVQNSYSSFTGKPRVSLVPSLEATKESMGGETTSRNVSDLQSAGMDDKKTEPSLSLTSPRDLRIISQPSNTHSQIGALEAVAAEPTTRGTSICSAVTNLGRERREGPALSSNGGGEDAFNDDDITDRIVTATSAQHSNASRSRANSGLSAAVGSRGGRVIGDRPQRVNSTSIVSGAVPLPLTCTSSGAVPPTAETDMVGGLFAVDCNSQCTSPAAGIVRPFTDVPPDRLDPVESTILPALRDRDTFSLGVDASRSEPPMAVEDTMSHLRPKREEFGSRDPTVHIAGAGGMHVPLSSPNNLAAPMRQFADDVLALSQAGQVEEATAAARAAADIFQFKIPLCEWCGYDVFACACEDEDEPFVTFIFLERLRDMRALRDHIVILDLFSALYDTSPTGDADGDESRAIDLFTVLHPIKSRDSHTPIVLLSMMEGNEFFVELWREHNYESILFITGCGVNVNDLAKCNLETARSVVIMASGEASSVRYDEISLTVALSVRQAVGTRNIPILTEIDSVDALYSFPPHYSNMVCYDTATTIATGEDPRARDHFAFASSVLTGSVLSTQMLDAAIFHNYFNPYMLKVVEALVGGSVTSYVKRLGQKGEKFEDPAFDPSTTPSPVARQRSGRSSEIGSFPKSGNSNNDTASDTNRANRRGATESGAFKGDTKQGEEEEEEGAETYQAVVGLSSMPNSRDDPFGRIYLDVVRKFAAEGVVVLGLYRVIRDERHGDLNGRRVMITNPPPKTTLQYDDIVYYISK